MLREQVIEYRRPDGRTERRRAWFVLDSQWLETRKGFLRLEPLHEWDDPNDAETVFVHDGEEPVGRVDFWREYFRGMGTLPPS